MTKCEERVAELEAAVACLRGELSFLSCRVQELEARKFVGGFISANGEAGIMGEAVSEQTWPLPAAPSPSKPDGTVVTINVVNAAAEIDRRLAQRVSRGRGPIAGSWDRGPEMIVPLGARNVPRAG